MITITFEGWFQCRLATNPDRYNEPRGRRGWTFALGSEPDLDRIIRFQNFVAPRSHAPAQGVTVRSVEFDGAAQPNHVLLGAPVQLIDGAVFEGRNGLIAGDGDEPIVPFHIQVGEDAGPLLRKFDPIDIEDEAELGRRQPGDLEAPSGIAAAATGITDPIDYRARRSALLQQDRAQTNDPVEAGALERRIQELANTGLAGFLTMRLPYGFELRGEGEAVDPANSLGFTPDVNATWGISFWMGAWDADGLCGYTKGALQIPTA